MLIAGFLSCQSPPTNDCPDAEQKKVTRKQIDDEIGKGNFTNAEKLINEYLALEQRTLNEVWELNFHKDLFHRIRRDFRNTTQDVIDHVKNYYPDVDSLMIQKWIDDKSLEMRVIDGERKFFVNAKRSLFRLNDEAKKVWEEKNGPRYTELDKFVDKNVPEIVEQVNKTGKKLVDNVKIKCKYKITVDANAVPDGEIIRCWMPFPREGHKRQYDIKLNSASEENYIIANNEDYLQRSIYLEKKAVKDSATVFQVEYEFKSYAEWYNLKPEDVKPYDKESKLYKEFTVEQKPHIVFSDPIAKITKEVVGNETNPYLIVRKIYTWIDENFPWASALEYSTFKCIPEYVLEQGHGDCGMQSLLFISMARCAGIPAKWQSGWMLHPNAINLHDWAEVYYEGIGWTPVDITFNLQKSENPEIKYFYTNGNDAYHFIVNDAISQPFFPAKIYPRSETVDFQRGEVEWRGGNLYFDKWGYKMRCEYEKL